MLPAPGLLLRGLELWSWEMEVTVLEVEGEKDVAGRNVQAAPAVARGRAVGGQACAARGHGYGPRVVRYVRHVVPPRRCQRVSVSGPRRLPWLAAGGAAEAAGRAQWWGLRCPQWGQSLRRCAAPRLT